MSLNVYFATARGIGVLSTSNRDGKVNVAVYSRPHFLGEGDDEVAFIMNDRLSHDNLQSNPHAAYLFVEDGQGYVGKRLFLTKVREETDTGKIRATRRRQQPSEWADPGADKKYLVHFRVDGIRPLIGTGEQLAASAAAT